MRRYIGRFMRFIFRVGGPDYRHELTDELVFETEKGKARRAGGGGYG